MRFNPQVLQPVGGGHPLIVFRKGRTKYHAVQATDSGITLVTLDSLRGLVEVKRKGEPYSPRKAASFWLNHDHREVTKRAKQVLRGLVARKAKAAADSGPSTKEQA